MATTIITPEDLQNFKQELLAEIQNLLSQRQTAPARKWLKSHEVRRLLTLSPGTLANLRVNGTLPYTKIGDLPRSEEHTSELQSLTNLVCRLLLEKKKNKRA